MGRLIQSEEEIVVEDGSKVVAKAKLFTDECLIMNTCIGSYKVISLKPCRDKSNTIIFYKYFLI
jgi:hypothetical protein